MYLFRTSKCAKTWRPAYPPPGLRTQTARLNTHHTSKWSKLCGASLFVEIFETIFVQFRNCLLYFLLFTFLKNQAAILNKNGFEVLVTQSKLSFCWSPLRVAGQIGGVSSVQYPTRPAPANPPPTPAQTRSLEACGTVTCGTHVFHTQNRVQTLFITETFNRLIFNFHTEQRAAVSMQRN